MSWRWIALALPLMSCTAHAQQPQAGTPAPTAPLVAPGQLGDTPPVLNCEDSGPGNDSGFLTGNHKFPGFINFISNPLQSIDPRAVTAIYPIFGSAWVSNVSPVP